MEIDDGDKHGEGGDKIHHVGKILSIERFFQSPSLVAPGEQEMEKTDDGSLKFWSPSSVYSRWRESFPDDVLTDIGRNEQGYTRSDPVSLLKHLIKENDNHAGSNQLKDQENDDSPAEVGRTAVYTGCNVYDRLPKSQDQCKHYTSAKFPEIVCTFLSGLEKFTIRFQIEVDVD